MDGVPARETVLLLHGLARGPLSMWPLARALRRRGYAVINLAYPTRRQDLGGLADLVRARLAAIAPAPGRNATLHGVGHSLGGLVLLAALLEPPPPWQAWRLVTLGSPHRGAGIAAQLDALARGAAVLRPGAGRSGAGERGAARPGAAGAARRSRSA